MSAAAALATNHIDNTTVPLLSNSAETNSAASTASKASTMAKNGQANKNDSPTSFLKGLKNSFKPVIEFVKKLDKPIDDFSKKHPVLTLLAGVALIAGGGALMLSTYGAGIPLAIPIILGGYYATFKGVQHLPIVVAMKKKSIELEKQKEAQKANAKQTAETGATGAPNTETSKQKNQ